MKNRIISLLLVLVLAISCLFVLGACNGNGNEGEGGGEGEGTGGGTGGGGGGAGSAGYNGEWWRAIGYEQTELRFQLTECPNAGLNPNTKRLLEGKEGFTMNRPLDKLIATRNDNAYFNTGVSVNYAYYGTDSTKYGWGNAMNTIYQEVQNKSKTSPDMYCNFMSDMLATSLKGSFANILSESRNSAGAGTVSNFFKVDETIDNEGYEHSGYMSDLMSSLTLSDEKFYVIASDYFIDLIRAFFVVPVNKTLYDQKAPTMIEDLNEDGVKDMNDFFEEVKNSDWTYDRLIEYCAAVAVDENNNTNWDINDTLGFALDSDGGMMASGLMYTTTLVIIKKEWDEENFQWNYAYPDENPDLETFASKVALLFNSDGVAAIYNADASGDAVAGIAGKFTRNEMLFGGIITVGNLENAEYQAMKGEGGGFGVVPVPVYTNLDKDGNKIVDPYQTQIHTSGGAGGISHVTQKFTQCSAFIQYQSTHSTEILNEYYDNNLTLDVADGMQGNVDMLKYVRNNVRTSFDKLFEDAISFFNLKSDPNAQKNRWHNLFLGEAAYRVESMRASYESLVGTKQDRLEVLIKEYEKLPD